MVDRYDIDYYNCDSRCGANMDTDPDGDYVLYSDYAALCEAVREWDRLDRDANLAGANLGYPDHAEQLAKEARKLRRHMLALANQ